MWVGGEWMEGWAGGEGGLDGWVGARHTDMDGWVVG